MLPDLQKKKFSVLQYPSAKTALIVLVLAVPLLILTQFIEIFLLVTFSIALTLVLYPAVDYFENIGLRRFNAALAVFGCLAVFLFVFSFFIFPLFLSQVQTMTEKLQKVSLDDKLKQVNAFIHPYYPKANLENIKPKLLATLGKMMMKIKDQASIFVNTAAISIFLPLFVFFGIKDFHSVQKNFVQAMPNKYFEMSLNFFYRIETKLSRYIRGILLQNTIVGAVAAVGFFAIGLDYSLILGLLIGVFNIVPIVGPLVGGVLPVLVAVVQYDTPGKLLLPILIFGLSQIANAVMRRIVLRSMLKLPPITILLTVALGNELMGVVGTILIIPIYTVLSATAKETYHELKSYKICAVD